MRGASAAERTQATIQLLAQQGSRLVTGLLNDRASRSARQAGAFTRQPRDGSEAECPRCCHQAPRRRFASHASCCQQPRAVTGAASWASAGRVHVIGGCCGATWSPARRKRMRGDTRSKSRRRTQRGGELWAFRQAWRRRAVVACWPGLPHLPSAHAQPRTPAPARLTSHVSREFTPVRIRGAARAHGNVCTALTPAVAACAVGCMVARCPRSLTDACCPSA